MNIKQNNMSIRTKSFDTKYGNIVLPINDKYFIDVFNQGRYFGKDDIEYCLSIINKSKNILEYGSHVGTHTIAYASSIDENSIVYSFEPQKDIFTILLKNIKNNNLNNKIVARQASLFHYTGNVSLNENFIDGDYLGDVESSKDSGVDCNYGGLTLGVGGEQVSCYKIDDLELQNLGFIHSDAQGSENIIFWGGRETISKFKPIIFFENANYDENNKLVDNIFLNKVKSSYQIDDVITNFDIGQFCVEELGYKTYIEGYNSYLIP